MAVQEVILSTDPHRPVAYDEKALKKVLEESYLIADVKKDGVRLNLIVQPGQLEDGWTVDWLSREGKLFPHFVKYGQPLCSDARWAKFFNENLDGGLYPEGFMLDAELVLVDENGHRIPCKNISGALRDIKKGAIPLERLRVYVFGIVPLNVIRSGQDYPVTHATMKYHNEFQTAALKNRFPEIHWEVVESLDCFNMDEVDAFYEKVRADGEEGLVLKDPNGDWLRGKRVGQWKCVPDDNEDGKVCGLVWGTAGLANEGKVIGFQVLLESGHVVNACKISRNLMEEFTAKVAIFGEDCYDGWTAKVTFMERYPDGSLRHPSFDSFRGISDPKIKE